MSSIVIPFPAERCRPSASQLVIRERTALAGALDRLASSPGDQDATVTMMQLALEGEDQSAREEARTWLGVHLNVMVTG